MAVAPSLIAVLLVNAANLIHRDILATIRATQIARISSWRRQMSRLLWSSITLRFAQEMIMWQLDIMG